MHTDDTQFDFSDGKGGAWITADGKFHYVRHYAYHTKTAADLFGWDWYSDGYEKGAIRYSSDTGRNHTNLIHIDFRPSKVTVEALDTLLRVMGQAKRHSWAADEFRFQNEDLLADRTVEDPGDLKTYEQVVDYVLRLKRRKVKAQVAAQEAFEVEAGIFVADEQALWSYA